jgi:hypothetical protein
VLSAGCAAETVACSIYFAASDGASLHKLDPTLRVRGLADGWRMLCPDVEAPKWIGERLPVPARLRQCETEFAAIGTGNPAAVEPDDFG